MCVSPLLRCTWLCTALPMGSCRPPWSCCIVPVTSCCWSAGRTTQRWHCWTWVFSFLRFINNQHQQNGNVDILCSVFNIYCSWFSFHRVTLGWCCTEWWSMIYLWDSWSTPWPSTQSTTDPGPSKWPSGGDTFIIIIIIYYNGIILTLRDGLYNMFLFFSSHHLVARVYESKAEFRSALQHEKEGYTIYKNQVKPAGIQTAGKCLYQMWWIDT